MEPDSAYDSPAGSWDINMSSTSSSPRQSPIMPKSIQSMKSSVLCTICNNIFTDPRVLPCFHTFCGKCLDTLKPTIVCKLCNFEYNMPRNGIQGFLPDYSMISFIKSLSKDGHNCDNCLNNATISIAVAKCFECNYFLCKHCNTSHCFSNYNHRTIDIPTDFSFSAPESYEPYFCVYCPQHVNNAVTQYCLTCNDLCCNICSEQEHIGHSIELVDAVKDHLMNSLVQKMDDNENRLIELNRQLKISQSQDAQLNSQYQEAQSRINETYNQFASILLKCKLRQQDNLDMSFKVVKKDLQSNFTICQLAYEQTARMSDFFFRLAKLGTKEEILMFKKLLEGKAKQLSLVKPPQHQFNLKFVSYMSDFEHFLNGSFGQVILDDGINFEKQKPSQPMYFKDLLSPTNSPWRYDRWSNTCFEDLRVNLTNLSISPESSSPTRSFQSLKSTVTRSVLTYTWKFGAYGTLPSQFTEPNGVAVTPNGDIIVADTNNNRVQIFDSNGHFKHSFGDVPNENNEGTLLFPNRVAVTNNGDIVVTERAPTHQVQIYSQYGQFIRKFGANILEHPRAVTVDKDGFIIVVECKVMRVVIFSHMGDVVKKFSCAGVLRFPNGVAVNDQRQIFISDNRNHCVVVYDYIGNKIRTIGNEGLTNFPIGVMLNKSGHVIVADNHNNFNLTVFTQEGNFIAAIESKVKHAQCYDCAISSDGAVALTSKDYRVYIYKTNF